MAACAWARGSSAAADSVCGGGEAGGGSGSGGETLAARGPGARLRPRARADSRIPGRGGYAGEVYSRRLHAGNDAGCAVIMNGFAGRPGDIPALVSFSSLVAAPLDRGYRRRTVCSDISEKGAPRPYTFRAVQTGGARRCGARRPSKCPTLTLALVVLVALGFRTLLRSPSEASGPARQVSLSLRDAGGPGLRCYSPSG